MGERKKNQKKKTCGCLISAELLSNTQQILSQNRIQRSIGPTFCFNVRNEAGVSGRRAADDCISTYSASVSGRLLFCMAFWRVSAQRAASAWSLETNVCVCVCVARQSVWVHRKPIETPAGYDCQPLIKQEKNISGLRHIWPPWKGQCVFFLFFWKNHFFLSSHPFFVSP